MLEKLRDQKVVVLVDCRTSHNFIAIQLVVELGLEVLSTPTYHVQVVDGDKIKGQGVCHRVKWQLWEMKFSKIFFPFRFGRS